MAATVAALVCTCGKSAANEIEFTFTSSYDGSAQQSVAYVSRQVTVVRYKVKGEGALDLCIRRGGQTVFETKTEGEAAGNLPALQKR